jgi:predicted nuclease of predicted toxin-antitoxin system
MNRQSSFNIRHITHDYSLNGLPDKDVFARARTEKRILVTQDGDFVKSRQIQDNTSVVKIIGGLTAQEIDALLCRLVKKFNKNEDYWGRIICINRTGGEILTPQEKNLFDF